MAWVSAGEEAASKVRPVSSSSTCSPSFLPLALNFRPFASVFLSTSKVCSKKGEGTIYFSRVLSLFAAGELSNKYS